MVCEGPGLSARLFSPSHLSSRHSLIYVQPSVRHFKIPAKEEPEVAVDGLVGGGGGGEVAPHLGNMFCQVEDTSCPCPMQVSLLTDAAVDVVNCP